MRHQFRTSVRARSSGLLGQKMQQVCNPAGRSRAQSYFGPLHVCAKTGAAVRVPVNSTHPDYDANAFRQTDRRFQAAVSLRDRNLAAPGGICHLPFAICWAGRSGAVAFSISAQSQPSVPLPHVTHAHSCSLMAPLFVPSVPFHPGYRLIDHRLFPEPRLLPLPIRAFLFATR